MWTKKTVYCGQMDGTQWKEVEDLFVPGMVPFVTNDFDHNSELDTEFEYCLMK